MTALAAAKNVKQMGPGGEPIVVPLPVAASTTIYQGSLVCDNGSGYAIPGSTATTQIAVGIAKATVDNSAGSDGDLNVEVERGGFRFVNSSAGDAIAIAQRYDVCFIVDDQTVAKTNGGSTRSRAGIIMDVDSYGVWVLVGTSLIFDYSTMETTLAGISAHMVSSDHVIPLNLYDFREVDSGGDVANIAANGGVLASDSTPILQGEATDQYQQIHWAADDVDPIAIQTALPANLDDTADVVIEFVVASGTTDAADLAVETTWDGETQVADAVDDSATKSATPHVVTATIATADVPASTDRLTLIITPPAHTTDAILLDGVRIKYTGKLLT